MVGGLLDFESIIQLDNFKKELPRTDVLFRAVKLEKSYKGSRLLIEKELAQNILPSEWYYTFDEYEENVLIHRDDTPVNSFKRKIAPNQDSLAYQSFGL